MGAYLPLPYVYEREGRQERAWDIYSRLLRDRIVFIGTPIDDYVANSIIAQLLFLQMEDPKKDVHLYINSPRGSVSDGMAIYDTLNFMQCDVVTYCIGMAASMSTVLLAAGTPGKRYALPNSRVMIHQPSGGAGGQTSDISIAAKKSSDGEAPLTMFSQTTAANLPSRLKKIQIVITTCLLTKPRNMVLLTK